MCACISVWTQYLQFLEQLSTIFRTVGLHQVDPVLHEEVLLRYALLLEAKAELSAQDLPRKIAGGMCSRSDLDLLLFAFLTLIRVIWLAVGIHPYWWPCGGCAGCS